MSNKLAILEKIAKGELTPDQAILLLHPLKGDDFANIYKEAHEAGLAAVEVCTPTPMVVQQHANMLDDNSPVAKQWFVPDGPCGFSWIHFAGNTKWGRWAKKNAHARAAYGGGLQIWVSAFNQSIQRKEAYAHAFAKVLNKYGIQAYANSRLD